jgi:OHCU decarboxylase
MPLVPIHSLNNCPDKEFIETVNTLFECAPPLQSALLHSRPFTTYVDLINQAQHHINNMNEQDKIQIVNAHPRIGAPTQQLSELSRIEQASKQEDNLTETLKNLESFNEEYESRFGFKFVVFVNGRSRSEILKVLQQRINNSRNEELKTGLDSMILIARDRLSKLSIGNK